MPVPGDRDGKAYFAHYDAWNRLIKITDDEPPPNTLHKAAYDGLGRRIKIIVTNDAISAGAADRTEHHDFHGQSIIEDRSGSDQVLRQRVWGSLVSKAGGSGYIDEMLQLAVNIDPHDPTEDRCHHFAFALHDANHNVMGLVTTTSATLIERYEYNPYGERKVFAQAYLLGDANYDGRVDALDPSLYAAEALNRTSLIDAATAAAWCCVNGRGAASPASRAVTCPRVICQR
jgi:YD repeat-containing protein